MSRKQWAATKILACAVGGTYATKMRISLSEPQRGQLGVDNRTDGAGREMKSQKCFALYLFLFAFVIRLAFLTVTYQDKERVKYMEDVSIAINLVEGRGYVADFSMVHGNVPVRPTAWKPPVYPMLVFLVFLAFGMKDFFALFVIHAILAAFTCTLLYLSIGKFSRSKGAIAGVAFAVYPPFVYHSVAIPESTTLTLFLISVFCYGLVNLCEAFSPKRWILVSIVSGLLAMTEPVTVPFMFLALLYIAYLTLDSSKKIFVEMFISLLVFAATIAPWTVRNYLVFNEVFFIKSNFGSTLKDSMHKSGIRLPKETSAALAREVQGMDEVNEDRAIQKALLSWILANPVAYLRLLPQNFLNFWWEVDRYKNNKSIRYLLGRKGPYILLLILSIPSMLWVLVQLGTNLQVQIHMNIYHHMMLILIITYTVIYTVVGAMVMRYHFPVQLGMFIFSAETIRYLINKGRLPSKNALRCLKTGL